MDEGSESRTAPHKNAIVFGSAVSHPGRRPARSTYYYQSYRSSEAIAFEQRIVQRLLELREDHPNDGYRRMTKQLQAEGFHVNRKRIARLMQLHNLTMRPSHCDGGSLRYRRAPSTSTASRENVVPTAPNQVWISDLAYVHIASGLIYTAAIIDVGSKEVVGYAASTHINPRLPALALHSAVRARRPALGCIHHSTYGMQYLMRGYRELLRQYGLIPVGSEAPEPPTFGATVCAPSGPARQIVDIPGYARWEEIVERSEEFIRILYSPERIEAIRNAHCRNGNASVERIGEGC
jgi:putative transposase